MFLLLLSSFISASYAGGTNAKPEDYDSDFEHYYQGNDVGLSIDFQIAGDDGSLEAKVLIRVMDKIHGKDCYLKADYPRLKVDLEFLRMLIREPSTVHYLPPYSYWFDVLRELEKEYAKN